MTFRTASVRYPPLQSKIVEEADYNFLYTFLGNDYESAKVQNNYCTSRPW